MNYKIKVYKTKSNEWSTKAYASVTFNNSFVVTGITVREGKNNNLFVAMPSYKSSKTDENGKPVYKDYCNPTTKEFRDELYGNIIDAYMNDKKELEVKGASNKFEFGIALRSFSGENIEALGRIYFDKCFVINNVKVIPSEKGSFVAMPSQLVNKENGEKEYEDVCFPITKEFRTELYDAILKEKDIMKQKQQEEFQKIDEMDKDNLPFRNDEFLDNDVRVEIMKIIACIPKQELSNIHICIDSSKKDNEGIRREWLKQFIKENLFTTSTIYTNSLVSIACDVTEINIFIALMHLFGINIYLENEEASIIPDPLYVGEIQKIIKTKLKEHPMCIAKANAEERAFVVNVVLDIIDNLWLDYRKTVQ